MPIFLDTGLSRYRLILATQDINFKNSSRRPHYNTEFFKLGEVKSLFLVALVDAREINALRQRE